MQLSRGPEGIHPETTVPLLERQVGPIFFSPTDREVETLCRSMFPPCISLTALTHHPVLCPMKPADMPGCASICSGAVTLRTLKMLLSPDEENNNFKGLPKLYAAVPEKISGPPSLADLNTYTAIMAPASLTSIQGCQGTGTSSWLLKTNILSLGQKKPFANFSFEVLPFEISLNMFHLLLLFFLTD